MELRSLVALLRGWIWMVIAAVILSVIIAVVGTSQIAPTYQSSTTLIVGSSLTNTHVDYNELLVSQTLAQTYVDIAVSGPVLEAAATSIGLTGSDADLSGTVTSRSPSGSSFVIITAEAASGALAASVANAVGTALIAVSPTDKGTDQSAQDAFDELVTANAQAITTTQNELTALRAKPDPTPEEVTRITALETQLVALQTSRISLLGSAPTPGTNTVAVVEPATAPSAAVGPQLLVNVALAVIIGLVASLVIIFAVEALHSDRRPTDAESKAAAKGA
jgi:capsular polysaccharide biosynthesis protein